MTRENLSRRTFAIGMLTAGVCEAATPIIDFKASKSPLINVSTNPNFLKNTSRKNFGDLDSLYFDPEPELSATTLMKKHNGAKVGIQMLVTIKSQQRLLF